MNSVPFRVRFQMYPRAEQLLVIPLGLVTWMILEIGSGPAQMAIIAVLCSCAMWVTVPDLGRYRAFGIPLRYWTVDTATAVVLITVVLVGVGAAASAGTAEYAGILCALGFIVVSHVATGWRQVRGDSWSVGRTRGPTRLWTVLSRGMTSLTGPLAWRLVYLPVAVATVLTAVLMAVLIAVLKMLQGDSETSFVSLATMLPLVMAMLPVVAAVLADGYRGWRSVGLPVRRWYRHAFVGSALFVVLLLLMVHLGFSVGVISTTQPLTVESPEQFALAMSFGALGTALLPFIAVSGGPITPLVGLVPAGGLLMTVETQAALRGPAPMFGVVAVLVLTAATVVWTYGRVAGGDSLRITGYVRGAERTYYERQGAL
ncbi:hypothetical protein [Corynebacterium sp.]|uniref:hypothetical protein n=1 Tax=Corynebacterium sp. TaxID=1720 RepID=UPI0025C1C31C|nr:hypothetical protein [Corynebacterium sp.]